jgi:hypothetical protein
VDISGENSPDRTQTLIRFGPVSVLLSRKELADLVLIVNARHEELPSEQTCQTDPRLIFESGTCTDCGGMTYCNAPHNSGHDHSVASRACASKVNAAKLMDELVAWRQEGKEWRGV